MRASIDDAEMPEDLNIEKLERKRASVDEAVLVDAFDTLEAFPSRLKRWMSVKARRYDHPAAEMMLNAIR